VAAPKSLVAACLRCRHHHHAVSSTSSACQRLDCRSGAEHPRSTGVVVFSGCNRCAPFMQSHWMQSETASLNIIGVGHSHAVMGGPLPVALSAAGRRGAWHRGQQLPASWAAARPAGAGRPRGVPHPRGHETRRHSRTGSKVVRRRPPGFGFLDSQTWSWPRVVGAEAPSGGCHRQCDFLVQVPIACGPLPLGPGLTRRHTCDRSRRKSGSLRSVWGGPPLAPPREHLLILHQGHRQVLKALL
jgi:hypothetical protein